MSKIKIKTFLHSLLFLKTDKKDHKILSGQNSKTDILQNNLYAISEYLFEKTKIKNSAIIFRGHIMQWRRKKEGENKIGLSAMRKKKWLTNLLKTAERQRTKDTWFLKKKFFYTIGRREKRHRTPTTWVTSYRNTSRNSPYMVNTSGNEQNTMDQGRKINYWKKTKVKSIFDEKDDYITVSLIGGTTVVKLEMK